MKKYNKEELIVFEEKIVQRFNNKEIKAPIHLDNGNEDQLIHIFKKYINKEDWVLGTWRQHYKCLLKGVPEEELEQAILEGRSIGLCFKKQKVLSSAIVGGVFPIAVGLAKGIQLNNTNNKVLCFAGEMSYMTGIARESIEYARNFKLPILWVCENNEKSVCTPTRQSWGLVDKFSNHKRFWWELTPYIQDGPIKIVGSDFIYYSYDNKYPHAGSGNRINF